MNKKAQELLFGKSIDMESLIRIVKRFVESIKETGDREKVVVEVINKNQFNEEDSFDEVVEHFDKKASSNKERDIDILRVWKSENYYIALGVKL